MNMDLQIKINPIVELIKHRVRFCVHGGMQREGNNFHNTFAPDVNWSNVRIIIIMAEMVEWKSRQIDYVLIFSQAPIDIHFHIHLPEGFHVDGKEKNVTYFLKLKKNIFGTCQSAENWFDMLQTVLKD